MTNKTLEQLWKEDPNRCFHWLVQQTKAEAYTRDGCKNCEGYAVYEADGEVFVGCTDYIRCKKLSLSKEGKSE